MTNDDIVVALRALNGLNHPGMPQINVSADQAADEIERLRKSLEWENKARRHYMKRATAYFHALEWMCAIHPIPDDVHADAVEGLRMMRESQAKFRDMVYPEGRYHGD